MITQHIHISSIYYQRITIWSNNIIHMSITILVMTNGNNISSNYSYYPCIMSITTIGHYQRVPMASHGWFLLQFGSLLVDLCHLILRYHDLLVERLGRWQNMGDFTMDNDVFTINVELCVIFSVYIYDIWYVYIYICIL